MKEGSIPYYECEYCGLRKDNPDEIKKHEKQCSENPANCRKIMFIEEVVTITDGKHCSPECQFISPTHSVCMKFGKELNPFLTRVPECVKAESLYKQQITNRQLVQGFLIRLSKDRLKNK